MGVLELIMYETDSPAVTVVELATGELTFMTVEMTSVGVGLGISEPVFVTIDGTSAVTCSTVVLPSVEITVE